MVNAERSKATSLIQPPAEENQTLAALNVATFNIRTLTETNRETDRGIRHKL